MNPHNHPSLPTRPISIVQSFHIPLSQTSSHTPYQQPLPSFSTTFHHSFHTDQRLPHQSQWLPSSSPLTPHHQQVPTLATVVPTHLPQQPHSLAHFLPTTHQLHNHSLAPLVSTPQNNTTPPYTLINPPATHPSQNPQNPHPNQNKSQKSRSTTQKRPPPTAKRTRTKSATPRSKHTPRSNPTSSTPKSTKSNQYTRHPPPSTISASPMSQQPSTNPKPPISPFPPSTTLSSSKNPTTQRPSTNTPPSNPITFTAPQPRSAAPALNFADVVLDTPVSQTDASRSRFSVYRQVLTARETVASGDSHPTLPCDTWDTNGFGRGRVDGNAATNDKINPVSLGHAQPVQECPTAERIETSMGSSDSKDNEVSAAECLTKLSQMIGEPQEYDRGRDQGSNIEVPPDSERHDEQETRREDPATRRRMNSKSAAHLKQAESQKMATNLAMQKAETQNNLPNFVSQSTYSGSIPGLSPTNVAEPQPARGPAASSAAMDSLHTSRAEYAKDTPVGVRDTRNLFNIRPSDSLPDLSRNNSLVSPSSLQHCTPPIQHQQPLPSNPAPSSNPSTPVYFTHQIARPLFQESAAVTSSMVPHQHTAQPMLPHPTTFLYPIQTHSNLANPQYQLQPCSQHQNETHPPVPQSFPPAEQPSQLPQFQQPSQHFSQPTSKLAQPSNKLLQSSQQRSYPSTKFSQLPQKPALPSPQPPMPSKQQQPPLPTSTPSQAGRVSKAKKRVPKKSAPRDPSNPLKSTKPKNKRTANKSVNQKRPRAPQKSQPASTTLNGQALGGTPSSLQTQPPAIPTPSIPSITKPSSSGLRLQAKLGTQNAASHLHVSTTSPHGEHLGHTQFLHNSQQPSALGQRHANEGPHQRSPWAQQHPIPPSSSVQGCNLTIRCAMNDSSKKTNLQKPKQRKSSPKKKIGAIEKAQSAAEKAAQDGKDLQSVPTDSNAPFVTKSAFQQRQQILRLHPPLPPATLQSTTLPNAEPAMLPSFQNLSTSHPSLDLQVGSAFPPILSDNTPRNVTSTGEQPSSGSRIAAPSTHGTHPQASFVGQDSSTFSPRTESTQQTLPADMHSRTPSDAGCSLDAENNAPLSQTRDHPRCSSVLSPSDSQQLVEPNGDKSHQHSGAYATSQQGLAKLILANRNNPAIAGASQSQSAVRKDGGALLNPAKRKKAPKSSSPSKRRKKNQPVGPEQESSTNKPHAETRNGTPTVMEDATKNGDTQQQSGQKAGSVQKRVPSPKKPGKGQTKNKASQQSKSVRKRPSPGTKTQRKNKPNQSKSGEASPASDGGSGLRLCIYVQKEDGQQSSETMTDPNEDSCDSPVTLEKACTGPKRASKSPQKKGTKAQKQAVRIITSAIPEKTQVSPCFAEELKNLRSSGILTAVERNSGPSPAQNNDDSIPKIREKPCALCQRRGSSDDMVKHPCFPLQVFDICKSCSDIVSKRVEENGAKRKEGKVTSEKAITEQTTLFVMLIEEMVRHFSPSDRGQRDLDRVYDFISNRKWSEMVERADSLSINFDMLTVLRVMLRKVGFSLRGGKLRWPAGEFILPSIADTRALVSNSIPPRIEDFRKGILPGEAAWDKTFPEHEKFYLQHSSCAIYERAFGLIGLRFAHVRECSSQNSSGSSCEVKFNAWSMGTLMYRTAAMLSGTVTQELLAKCWTKEEALRFISEVETELVNESFQGAKQSCCICGGSGKHFEGSATLRFSNCTECLKSFCSICLLNVLGTSEYLRSFEENGYCCMLCRLHKNAELKPEGKMGQGKKDHRSRPRESSGIKKGAERRTRALPPLLLLSNRVRADVLLRSEVNASRKSLGFAMFCEVVNENSVRCGINPQSDQNLHDMCLECKLPADDKKVDGERDESLRCGQDNCRNVMHRSCIAPQRQIRRRGSRSKWCCPHHQCLKCEQHDESKLMRCRTCPATYCKEHMPLPSEVYIFSEKSFACGKCRSSLRIPQPLRLKVPGSKSERKRNAIAQALAIDQRRRSSAVKRLSEGPGTRCFEPAAFNELRITT